MSKTSLKVFTLFFILMGCVIVLVYSSPKTQKVFAFNPTAADSFNLPDSKELPKKVTLGKDSMSEEGEVAFDHDTHSFNKYSPDGKTDITCVECHHTDQPKSALTGNLVTAERDVILTVEALKKPGAPDVKSCRTCHFQSGNIPEGKEMPTGKVKDDKGNVAVKELNNEIAYHLNCNVCHDAAAKLRPELKNKKNGFATSKDCLICHEKN